LDWLKSIFYLLSSIYLKMGVQTFVCLSVCWYVEVWWKSKPAHWNFPSTSPPVQGRFWCRLEPPCPLHPGPGGLETLKAEGHIFKMLSRLQINLATSASSFVKSLSLKLKHNFKIYFIFTRGPNPNLPRVKNCQTFRLSWCQL